MKTSEYFPADYFSARDAFCARTRGGIAFHENIQAPGPRGEALSVDAVYVGSVTPGKLVVITSGVHGVEGYAGSALQQLWLDEFADRVPPGTGFLLVHAVNPYGFAHNRRVNENNVDLNRNALVDFPGPVNSGYRALNDWLNPANAPPRMDDFAWRLLPSLLHHGRVALTQAIAAGQYEFPRGLFYGGAKREASLSILWGWLTQPRFAQVQRVWHLDLHAGLGRRGGYQLLVEVPLRSQEHLEWVRGFGAGHVKSDHVSNVTHYSAHGLVPELTRRAFAHARASTATVEFGTVSALAMLQRLRAENRLHHFGEADHGRAHAIRKALVDAAAPDDHSWRQAVIEGGQVIFSQLHRHITGGA